MCSELYGDIQNYRIKSLQDNKKVRFAAPVSMRNEWSTVRIKHKVTGSMLNKKLEIGLPIAKETNGRIVTDTVNMWMHHVDYKVEEQFSEYKNNALVFGRSNRNQNGEYTNIGKSGGVIRTGAGLKNVKIALLAA